MLITIVEAVSCENPRCLQFAKPVKMPNGIRTYYCQVCGSINYTRGVDAEVVSSPTKYAEYLKKQASAVDNH